MNGARAGTAALVVGLCLIAYQPRAAADPPPVAAGNTKTTATSVLLLANLREADEACRCGDIIRAVRAAAARGVKTREVDTFNRDEAAKVSQKYRVLVSPTVLFLDGAGKEVSRLQGESEKTLADVKTALSKMAR